MLLVILAACLAVSAGKEATSNIAEKNTASGGNADDIVLLEIDVKEPEKRSPITATGDYGATPSQYIIRHSDDTQELSPAYLAYLQQYTHTQPQAYDPSTNQAPKRRPVSAISKQQQALQQAYQNYRKPAVVPPRPRLQYHPQALAQLEAAGQIQGQIDAQNRAAAIRTAKLGVDAPTYDAPGYSQKLGTFEQELLQLVSANQAQEFKLVPTQPKGATSAYSQQLVGYAPQYAKPAAAPVASSQLPEQYHIETSPPRYHQPRPAATYQSAEEPQVQYQYQAVHAPQAPEYSAKPAKPFRPSPQYEYPEENAHLKALQQAEAQAEAEALARAQAQALAYQKVAQAAHNKHQSDAFEQIRIVNERHRQQTALEQIQQGGQVSDAGRSHIEEQLQPKDPEAAYRAKVKAQAAAEAAEARRLHEAAGFKAHADAIRKLEAQQQAHLKAQEDAHRHALNFERNQLRAQAHAQAIAQAQAEALYKVHQQARAKAHKEAHAAARAQAEARKLDPEHTPVVQYLLPNSTPLPPPNSYLTSDHVQKYQASGSSYVPRSVPKNQDRPTEVEQEQAYVQPIITQPRDAHKLKIPPSSQASVYVSQSGLLKKSPIKSLTIEGLVSQDESAQLIRVPTTKERTLTEEDLSALINAGYTVTPVPQTVKPTQQSYAIDSSSPVYYAKKQRVPVTRPEYITYEEVIQRPRRPSRKNQQILKQDGEDAHASEKITYLVPLEPAFGTKEPSLRRPQ